MGFRNIIYEKGEVTTLILNRPDISNGLNISMCQEILEVIEKVRLDESAKILVIKAVGKIFSIGGDLTEMQRAVATDNVESLVDIAKLVNCISLAVRHLSVPVIMCVDGPIAGASANIAVASDFVIASERAKFIQAFVGIGLAPDAGGLLLMSRAIGITRAVQLAMTGESLTAQKAFEYGIIYKLCESEKLERVTNQLIKRLLHGSKNSYRAIKQMAWKASFEEWDDYAQLELQLQKELAFKEDFKEGVRAFSEKRRPKFSGK